MALIINPITSDNYISQIEQAGNVTVTGSVTGAFKTGDIVTLVVNGKTYSGKLIANGSFAIFVSGVDLAKDTDKTIAASVSATNASGNVVVQTVNKIYNADTGGPNASTTKITLDPVTADNILKPAEAQGNVTITGKVTGIYLPGDQVTLVINGTTYVGTVIGRGSFSIVVRGSDLVADSDKVIDASVAAHNASGVLGTVTSISNPYVVESAISSVSSSSVNEGDNLVYTVALTSASNKIQTFSLGQGGSASAADYGAASFSNGVSYNPLTGMITVPAGVTAFSVTLPTVDDSIDEPDETLVLSVGGVAATGTIIDNDTTPTVNTVEVGVAGLGDDTVAEGSAVVYNVTLSNASSTPSQLSLSVGGGTASAADYGAASFSNGVSYNPLTGMITVPAGVTAFSVTLPTVDDSIDEPDETLVLSVGGVAATGTIIDNDLIPSTGGSAIGLEDSELTLTWANFKVHSSLSAISNLDIVLKSLPLDGVLKLDGVAIGVGTVISKAAIDAGQLVFSPDANESGEDRYNVVGTGNKLNDYAKFGFQISRGGIDLGSPVSFTLDIAPDADVIGATSSGLLATSTSSRYHTNDWNKSYDTYGRLPVNIHQPSPDADGSERVMLRISGSTAVYVNGSIIPWGGPNNHYYQAADGYWVNAIYLANTTVAYSTTTTRSYEVGHQGGGWFGGSEQWKYNIETTISPYYVNIEVHNQEVNAAGVVLDEYVINRGRVDLANYSQSTWTSGWTGWVDSTCPLVLDLNSDGVHTLGTEYGVEFDLRGTGDAKNTGWVDKHDGLLVLDLNQDGIINSGVELFGDGTLLLAGGGRANNGFEALAQYDDNQDGKIDASDSIFASLQVWVDANSDGVTQDGELLTLGQAGVTSISLDAQDGSVIDNGNLLGLVGSYTGTDGAEHGMADVWFANGSSVPEVQAMLAQPSLDALLDAAGLPVMILPKRADAVVATIMEVAETGVRYSEEHLHHPELV